MLASLNIMFLESPVFTAAMCLASVVAGLVAGSIVYTVAWRMTHDRPVFTLRSWCPECGHPLTLGETIPVVSWIRQRGMCRHCGNPVSFAYPTSELLCAGIFTSVVLRHGIGIQTLEVLAFCCVLMTVSLTSMWDYSIPNSCLRWAVAIRLAYLAALAATGEYVVDLAISSLVGAIALGLPLLASVWLSNAVLARDITGMGTVKLVAVMGLYLGWQQGLIAIACAILLWMVVWLLSPYKLVEVEVEGGVNDDGTPLDLPSPRDIRATLEEDVAEPMRLIPFAPPIAIACWVMLLLGVMPAVWNSPLF